MLSIPAPSGNQLTPFHLAIRLTSVPPELVKLPPAHTLPSAAMAMAVTRVFASPSPAPSADQLDPSDLAIFLALMPPAVLNLPRIQVGAIARQGVNVEVDPHIGSSSQ